MAETPLVDVGVMAPNDRVNAGVVVGVATVPLIPLAVVTETEETVPVGVAKVPSPLKNVVVLLGGVGTAPPTVDDIAGKSELAAMLKTPVVVVFFKIPVARAPRN